MDNYSKSFYPDTTAIEISHIYDDLAPQLQQRAIFVPGYWHIILSRRGKIFR